MPKRSFPAFINATLECSREREHQHHFYFHLQEDRRFTKIGQFPSLADSRFLSTSRFKKVIDKAHLKELNSAIGLASHGVGIGSFVYLRRIFEHVIFEAAQQKIDKGELIQEDFIGLKMDKKVEVLKDVLPPLLYESRRIYGLMSKGIHELTEERCLEIFPIILSGIELILEDWLLIKEREDQVAKAKARIQGVDLS